MNALTNPQELDIKYIKILSDSQAAIKALNNSRITSKSVLTALECMETLALKVNHLTLAWIKAHVGTEGNEQADQAAKEGAAGGAHMKKLILKIPDFRFQKANILLSLRATRHFSATCASLRLAPSVL